MNFAEERFPNDDAAGYLGIAPITLKNSRSTGKLGDGPAPEYFRVGKKIYYTKTSLNQYIESRRVISTFESDAHLV
jgi:hypothetical protein